MTSLADFPAFNRLKQCRYGTMLFNMHDIYIGRSLEEYGEFSEGEVELFRQIVRPGQLIVEVGANIGAHTVFLAQAAGPRGTVLAFEPQRIVYQTLCANVALNNLSNVHGFCTAVGKEPGQISVPACDPNRPNNFGGLSLGTYTHGELTPVVTIDGFSLSRCDFLKVDVEGMELDVLQGAAGTIQKCRPLIYVENDRPEKSVALIRYLDQLGYNMYWHKPPLFNPNNFAGNPVDVFPRIVSINMLCIPKNVLQQMEGFEQVQVPEK